MIFMILMFYIYNHKSGFLTSSVYVSTASLKDCGIFMNIYVSNISFIFLYVLCLMLYVCMLYLLGTYSTGRSKVCTKSTTQVMCVC